MKEISFDNRFELTDLVLSGNKTQTRVIISQELVDKYNELLENYEIASSNVGVACTIKRVEEFLLEHSPYHISEIVAVDIIPSVTIKITDIRVEELQNINEEDCLKEGVIKHTVEIIPNYPLYTQYCYGFSEGFYDTPQEAFAKLFNKINGKGTWDSNPYVFVYDFELVK